MERELVFSQSLIHLPTLRIADVVRFVDRFQGDVRRSKLDKGYTFFFEQFVFDYQGMYYVRQLPW